MPAFSAPPADATKKCPHCGQWTRWQQQPTDRCEHCGQVLEPYRAASDEERRKLEEKQDYNPILIEIQPDDSAVVRFFKHIIRGGQMAFAALVAFVVWLVTVIAG
ncbi:hypothetical protein GCM10023185_12190 [Hymenobacter saemangeumensis]|uniref:Uncharacterized protein n=1 Tax=Hymenobacter saemangeumensis TaxID=1084522 RepID=A0ABP8I6W2_9BACT